MGTFRVPIEVSKPYGDEFISIEALVDTGATYSVIPGDVLTGLGTIVEENRVFDIADGGSVELPIGHATIRVGGKQIITQVVFGSVGGPTLLGATTLEGASLAVDPIRQVLVPVNALLMSGMNGATSNGASDGDIC